jgi:tetratricopeptide (TPR) repeat protein
LVQGLKARFSNGLAELRNLDEIEPWRGLINKLLFCRSNTMRPSVLSILAFCLAAIPAAAGPLLDDDLATCRERQGDPKARHDACERLIADGKTIGKDLALAYAVRGNAFYLKRDQVRAVEAFSKAIELDPDNVAFLNSRGWSYELRGQDDLALADFNLALQKRPNVAVIYNNRGMIYLRKGALQSALDDFNAALKFKPDMYYAHTNRGRVLAMNKDFDGALADFAEAERIDPNPPQAGVFRCVAYTDMGKFDDAIDDCNKVIAKVPNYLYALCSRAEAHMGKRNLDAALKDLNTALGYNPNHVRAHMDRGRLFEKRGDLAQARADYRSAAYALTPFDEIDVAMARKMAQERLAALTSQGGAASNAGRRIALVIGNGAYKNVHPLDNPARDAKLVASALHEVGFQSVTLSNDLSRDKFFEVLRAFADEAERADWAVIYYAGHGFEIGGVNYLVPVDAKLVVDTDAEKEAVALEQVIASVGGARKLRLVMLDACRDNPFAATMQHTIALKLVDKGFSDIEPSAGFMVVYAAKHGETALDGEGTDSPFAVAVARDVREPRVEVRKLFDIVRDDVWAATKHAQQPFTYGSPAGREDFYFVVGAAAPEAAQGAPARKR